MNIAYASYFGLIFAIVRIRLYFEILECYSTYILDDFGYNLMIISLILWRNL